MYRPYDRDDKIGMMIGIPLGICFWGTFIYSIVSNLPIHIEVPIKQETIQSQNWEYLERDGKNYYFYENEPFLLQRFYTQTLNSAYSNNFIEVPFNCDDYNFNITKNSNMVKVAINKSKSIKNTKEEVLSEINSCFNLAFDKIKDKQVLIAKHNEQNNINTERQNIIKDSWKN